MARVTFNPETTIGGDVRQPIVVPPPNQKSRNGWEQFDTLINVKVGPPEKVLIFQTHMSLLCDASASSKRALAGSIERFKQDDDYVIELRKESGAVFNHFHHWLYTSHILESGHAMDASWPALIEMWIFGENYDAPKFQDAAMNAMIDKIDKGDAQFRADQLGYIYENTIEGALLRQLFRDYFIIAGLEHPKWWGPNKTRFPQDFLIEVIRKLHDQ